MLYHENPISGPGLRQLRVIDEFKLEPFTQERIQGGGGTSPMLAKGGADCPNENVRISQGRGGAGWKEDIRNQVWARKRE